MADEEGLRYRERLRAHLQVLESIRRSLAEGSDGEARESAVRVARFLEASALGRGFDRIADRAGKVGKGSDLEAALDGLLAALREALEGADPPAPGRVLVVEDDPVTARVLASVLERSGQDVVGVASAEEAWRAVEGEIPTPDLVLLDLLLPDSDGRVILAELRERQETASVPILVLSTRTGSRVKAECFALGADAVLEKPVDPEILSAAITSHLRRGAAEGRDLKRDHVTDLLNQVGVRDRYERLEKGENRCLGLVAVDGFGALTGRLGAALTDLMLRSVGMALARSLPESAVVGRWRGGRFLTILPGVGEEGGMELLEATVAEVRQTDHLDGRGEPFRVTASAGLAVSTGLQKMDELVAEAERGLYRAREAGGNRVHASAPGSPGRKATEILVAEDDPLTVKLLRHRLEKEGFRVRVFEDGVSAYDGALEETPALMILDVKLPGMDGFELLKRLRKTEACREIPILMLTSMGGESDVVRGFEAGADDYVLKPFSPVELLARIRRLLTQPPPGGG